MTTTTTNFKSIQLLRQWCMLTLPTVFNDALSYNEQVCKLTEAINEMATTINGLPDYIIELVKELLDQMNLEEIVKQVLADYFFINVKNPPAPLVPAVGDGVADDTVAIQAMIDYVTGKSNYLFFPAGTYSVQGLNMVPGISLIGLNRYNTTIMLRPSSNKDLLIGELGQCTISNITLNANMPGQTANCAVFEGNVTDMLVSDVILKNGYNVLSIDCDGIVQMDNIVIDGTQGNGLSIGGVRAMIRGITFTKNSTLNTGTLITITGENNMLSDVLNTEYAVNGIVINGNNNSVKGWMSGTTTAITNNGTNNEIQVYTGTDLISNVSNVTETITGYKHQNITSNKDETITGNKGVTVGGNITEKITGSETKTIGGSYQETLIGGHAISAGENVVFNGTNVNIASTEKSTITGTDIELNPTNNLKYPKADVAVDKYFNGIPIDALGGERFLLTKGTGSISADINSVKEAPYFTYFFTPYCETVEYYPQGCCLIDDNTMVCAYNDPTGNTNTAILQKIDLNTGAILLSNTVQNAYHCNSLTYIPSTNEIYSVRYYENGITGESNQIIVFNADTLTINRTFVVNGVSGISYMNYQGNTLYFADHATYVSVYSCNLDGSNVSKLFTSQFNTTWLSYVDKNLLTWMTNGFNGLICYDLSGNLVGTYKLDLYSSDMASCLIEIEAFMEKSDGTLLFADVGYVRRQAGIFRRHVINSFNKSIAKNIPMNWNWRNTSATTQIICRENYATYQCGYGLNWAYDSIEYAVRMCQQIDASLITINGNSEVFDQWVVVRSKNLIYFNLMTIKGMVIDYSKVTTARGLTITSDCASQVASYVGINRPTCLALWRFSEFISNTANIDGKNVEGVNGVYQGYLSNAKLTGGRIVNCANNIWGAWSVASWFGGNSVDFTADSISASIRNPQYGSNMKERFGNVYGYLIKPLTNVNFGNFTTQTFNAKSFKGNMLSMSINGESFVFDLTSSKVCSATTVVGGVIANVRFTVAVTDNARGVTFSISGATATPSSVALSSVSINNIILW